MEAESPSTIPVPGRINLQGGSTANLTAQTTGGATNMILFFQDPANTAAAIALSGGSTGNIQGALYFPDATLTFSGGSSTTPENVVSGRLVRLLSAAAVPTWVAVRQAQARRHRSPPADFMNRVRFQTEKPKERRCWLSEKGQSAIELAIVLPVLVLLLLVVSDFARVFFVSIAVNNAARAGAQYGSQSVQNAATPAGMVAAANADGANIPGLEYADHIICTCVTTTPQNVTNAPQATARTRRRRAMSRSIPQQPFIPS